MYPLKIYFMYVYKHVVYIQRQGVLFRQPQGRSECFPRGRQRCGIRLAQG